MVGPSPTLLSLYIRFSFKLQFGGIGSSCKIVVSILCNFLYFREIVKLQFNFWRIKHMERWYSRELDESCEEPVEVLVYNPKRLDVLDFLDLRS